jgi:hypothetical protein
VRSHAEAFLLLFRSGLCAWSQESGRAGAIVLKIPRISSYRSISNAGGEHRDENKRFDRVNTWSILS